MPLWYSHFIPPFTRSIILVHSIQQWPVKFWTEPKICSLTYKTLLCLYADCAGYITPTPLIEITQGYHSSCSRCKKSTQVQRPFALASLPPCETTSHYSFIQFSHMQPPGNIWNTDLWFGRSFIYISGTQRPVNVFRMAFRLLPLDTGSPVTPVSLASLRILELYKSDR